MYLFKLVFKTLKKKLLMAFLMACDDKFTMMYRPINWFAEQINWLISRWCQLWRLKVAETQYNARDTAIICWEFLALFDKQPALKNVFEKKDRNTEKCRGKSCGKFGVVSRACFPGELLKGLPSIYHIYFEKVESNDSKNNGWSYFLKQCI